MSSISPDIIVNGVRFTLEPGQTLQISFGGVMKLINESSPNCVVLRESIKEPIRKPLPFQKPNKSWGSDSDSDSDSKKKDVYESVSPNKYTAPSGNSDFSWRSSNSWSKPSSNPWQKPSSKSWSNPNFGKTKSKPISEYLESIRMEMEFDLVCFLDEQTDNGKIVISLSATAHMLDVYKKKTGFNFYEGKFKGAIADTNKYCIVYGTTFGTETIQLLPKIDETNMDSCVVQTTLESVINPCNVYIMHENVTNSSDV
jgi:hypothetical protein